MLHDGTPQAIVADGTPAIQLIVDGERSLLTLRCEAPSDLAAPEFERLDQLEVRRSTTGGGSWLEVQTEDVDLFPFFVAFSATVADDVQLDGAPVHAALQRSLRLFRRLVRDIPLLSPERQLGLFGELWVLDRLVRAHGEAALASWLGPNAEAHDFRWAATELEVKTTRRQHRHHKINGLDQLDPSPDGHLFLLSLQFAAAGQTDSGTSLAEAIAATRSALTTFGQDGLFDSVLIDRFDLAPEYERHYVDRLKLRTEPRLIRIVHQTPRLVREDVMGVPRDGMERVLDADYLLNCEGLGVPDGSEEFTAVIP
jgi:hypothetical protein